MRTLKLDLIGNAKSSLHHAVDHLTENQLSTVDDVKQAILSVTHVIELLFKEKLRQSHEAFVWKNIDKFPSKEAYTVSLDEAKNRLLNICGVKFTKDHIRNIESIKKIRNEIEHYQFEIEKNEADVQIGRMMSFVFWFSREHLGLDWETELRSDDTWKVLLDMRGFYEERKKEVEKRMCEEERFVVDCPECGVCAYDMEADNCEMCFSSNLLVECQSCGVEFFEDFMSGIIEGWCKDCEYQDGFAQANFEKY